MNLRKELFEFFSEILLSLRKKFPAENLRRFSSREIIEQKTFSLQIFVASIFVRITGKKVADKVSKKYTPVKETASLISLRLCS